MQGNSFNYKYSAPTEKERREIESIRRQYVNENGEEWKLTRLKKLHAGIIMRATLSSVFSGGIGILVFGAGMAFILKFDQMMAGLLLSALGILLMILAYLVYKVVFNSLKKKYSEEIIRLSDELLG